MATSGAGRGGADGDTVVRGQTLDDILLSAGGRDPRRLPRMVAQAFGVVRAAAPRHLALTAAMQVVAGLAVAGQLLVVREVLLQVQGSDTVPDVTVLVPDLVLFGLLLVVVGVSGLVQREVQRVLAERVAKHTTGQVMDVATTVDLVEFDRPSFHDRLQRARVNASARPLQIAGGVVGMLGGAATVVAVGATVIWLEPLVAVLLVVGGVPALVTNRLAARALHAHHVRQVPADRRRAYLYQVLSRREEAQEIRAFDSSAHLRAEHDRSFDAKVADLEHTVRRRVVLGSVGAAATAAVTVSAVVLLLWFVQIGRLALSDAAVAVGAVVILGGRLRALVAGGGTLYEGALFLQDFLDFVRAGELARAAAPRALPTSGFGDILLRDVGFTYPSRDEPSLQGVSLALARGEAVALVGENGSGKTTLTKILAGLYRPTTGSVLWNGHDTAEVDLEHLRDDVTVIFQDFSRYFLTAHENIAIGRIRDADDRERVRAAARDAGADGFLAALPQGYDTLLGPAFLGGSDLSTGQWQRIALARAYFRDAPLLILDEPTAALDPRGEFEIFQQVRRIAAGRTVVLVSHRFSTVRAADRILVLAGGRIVEDGTHDDLVGRDGLYAELFALQAEGYRATP